MRLIDLRKHAIKKQHRIRFHLRNGMECVMDQRGVALVILLAGGDKGTQPRDIVLAHKLARDL